MAEACQHLDQIDASATPTSPDQCLTCVGMGDEWVNLRLCLTCGNVGCCDSSKNKHATGHSEHTRHPVIQSYQPDETWRYCYAHAGPRPDGKAFR